jgi:hypothetical protein
LCDQELLGGRCSLCLSSFHLDVFLGIAPGVGVGTIIENNVIANAGAGVTGRVSATKNLVIRDKKDPEELPKKEFPLS